MGYTTEFDGSFELTFEPTQDEPNDTKVQRTVFELVNGLADTRRMKRDLSLFTDGELRGTPVSEFGTEGEFYHCRDGYFGQSKDDSILDYNKPPSTQPSLWLQWIIVNYDGNLVIEWDGGEKFYYYTEWLIYVIDKIIAPAGGIVNGTVYYQGDDCSDNGTIKVINNEVTIN